MDFQAILEGYAPLVGIILLSLLWLFLGAAAFIGIVWLNGVTNGSRQRFQAADHNPAVLRFGQSDAGKFVHSQLERAESAVDEPTDEIVIGISKRVNQLARRQVLSPVQASNIMMGLLHALQELTDGEPVTDEELDSLSPKAPVG